MSGQVTADCSITLDPVPAYEELTPPEDHAARAGPGWWIVPCAALGIAFWALIISWMFGFG